MNRNSKIVKKYNAFRTEQDKKFKEFKEAEAEEKRKKTIEENR